MDLIMEQFELDMDILQSKYERVNEDLEFLIRKCDMKYIAESGTEDDLTALYTEANEQANEKKKNIFQKMLERIKEFIQKIIGKIKGKKDKIEDDKEYEVNDISNHLSESKKLSSELKSAINSKNPEKISAVNSKIKKLKIALGIGVGVGVATTVILKKKKMRGSGLKTIINEVEKAVVDQDAEIKRISSMIDHLEYFDNIKEIQDAMNNLTHVNSELVNKLTDKQNEIAINKLANKKKDIQKREENIKELETILADDKKKDSEEINKTKDIINSEIELIEYTIEKMVEQKIENETKSNSLPKNLTIDKRLDIINKLSHEQTKIHKDIIDVTGLQVVVERLLHNKTLKLRSVGDIYTTIELPRNPYIEKYRKNN